MTDERPRPQYGEYATPEQQAAAMGQTYVPPTPEPPAPTASAPDKALDYVRPTSYPGRFITVFLLVLGAFNLVTGVPAYLDLSKAFNASASEWGGSLPDLPSSVNAAGIPVLVANVVLYGLTVLWSVWAMRRGRPSAYIPIVGFFAFATVFFILLCAFAPGYFQSAAA